VDPARPRSPVFLAFNIGLVTWETVVVIHKGANDGYPLREGTQSARKSRRPPFSGRSELLPDALPARAVRGAYLAGKALPRSVC